MGRKRQQSEQQRDRISELPAHIVDMILGLLPIEQAARMTVLSTFWRDMWFSLTKLHFDFMFFVRIQRKYSHACSDMGTQTTQEEKKNSDVWVAAALYVINKVLNQHNGLIHTFFIDFKDLRKTLRSRLFDLDQWFLFVTRKGVEEMDLTLMDEDRYRLPNCIFSCLTLKGLHINGVSVESINARCTLPNVISLCFENVDFDSVDLPVPVDFPMLKNLSFISCDNLSNLNITAQKLENLTINNCCIFQLSINSDLRSVRTLDLDNYALKEFVKRCTGRGLQPQPLALNVEYLRVSEHSFLRDDISSAFIHLLRMCPKLCQLDISLLLIDVLGKLSEEFHTVAQGLEMLHNLNVIEFGVAYKEDIVFIKGLLPFFPALEEVVIRRSNVCESDEDFENYKEELLHSQCASAKAEIVMYNYNY
ncbi:PREDICTED: F-box/FBD/LRR-repeat protein At1g13570-like isoform X1 [Ipomoea nil]|uniref:F-box/FBD/LRR-repeat protein At1g13570-like isoform X1 n=1 Tax=Ipomoea nil TaxID=35883 RepID=UPI0009008C66|nr:PREDICTED: F-box/FBD/LRR-repeat protein At1g13570-like isoform X1 [Ipomoea nil]